MLKRNITIIILCFLMSGALIAAKHGGAKNIIFMVPDGMGLSNVTAARIYAFGSSKKRFFFEKLPEIGYQSTHSRDSVVTDSAAAASAWACGEKFRNGEISFHTDLNEPRQTILELAQTMGKGTGLVATSTVTHATPAAFAAHVSDRDCENEIARQYIEVTKVDIILGAGKGIFQSTYDDMDICGVWGDLLKIAEVEDYRVVSTRKELLNLPLDRKVLGVFRYVSMTPGYQRERQGVQDAEPTLAEMTGVALKKLGKNTRGFFLLVEGSQIDWANHSNNLEYQISEIIEFDLAVKEVLDWINHSPRRKEETLLIIVPDHDCGGFAVTGPLNHTPKEPGTMVEGRWVWGSHTGEDTIIWSQGPYSNYLGRAVDNTDVYYVMRAALLEESYSGE
jgi:alkaline phosphatase